VSATPQLMADLYRLCFAKPWTAESFERLISSPGCRVLCLGSEPLEALLIYRVVADEAEIITVCTHPEHRQRGLARNLLGEMEADLAALHVRKTHLEVRVDNQAAIGLYTAMGYKENGRRPNYYKEEGREIDGLQMVKPLVL